MKVGEYIKKVLREHDGTTEIVFDIGVSNSGISGLFVDKNSKNRVKFTVVTNLSINKKGK